VTERSEGRGWSATVADGSDAVIILSGDWIGRTGGVEHDAAHRILETGARTFRFDSDKLGRWDSALIVFLSMLRDGGSTFDQAGLPSTVRQLLALVPDAPAAPMPPTEPLVLERVGLWAISVQAEATEVVALLGNTCLRGGAALGGRSSMRGRDLLECLRDAGVAALPIVTVVNVLVGGILAFVGAVQLRRFGADVYVASMVGVAVVREMAALMTAIIIAGRTGGAYAANIATMQGNEEIDALRTFGIPVFDFLVLPRILALTAMMPILYLYGCAVGILGGFVVAVATLDVSPISYMSEIRATVSGRQFVIGLTKSVAFGALIAIVGCRVGLRAGRGAVAVGEAATAAVVAGIVGIIVLDAIFAICARALGV
jgi:phospholipid/cholesterol/gamma-HCH transport system permease protein